MLNNLRKILGEPGPLNSLPGNERPADSAPPGGPGHIAIIMDGNGRWATQRGLPRVAGHRAGVEALKKVVKACPEFGVRILTVYAFSTENWKRPQAEIESLMGLLVEYCRREVNELKENGVQIRTLGRIEALPRLQRTAIQEAIELTGTNQRLVLNLALNYGGHAELVDAIRKIATRVQAGELQPEGITEELVAQHLYTAGLPEPDLVIRTAGELRLSNFLLWQAAYAEFWVTPVFWPEFSREHLAAAVSDYARRERRFGASTPVAQG